LGVKVVLDTGTRETFIFPEGEVSDHFSCHRITEWLRLEGTSGGQSYLLSTFSPWSWIRRVTSSQGNECRGKEAGEESGQVNSGTLGEWRTGLAGMLYNPWITNQVLRLFLCSYSGLSQVNTRRFWWKCAWWGTSG